MTIQINHFWSIGPYLDLEVLAACPKVTCDFVGSNTVVLLQLLPHGFHGSWILIVFLTLVFYVILLLATIKPLFSNLLLINDKKNDIGPILRDIHPYRASEQVFPDKEGKEIVLEALWMIAALIFIGLIVMDNKVKRGRVEQERKGAFFH